MELQTPQKTCNLTHGLVLDLLHTTFLVGIGKGLAEMLVEGLLGRSVMVLRKVLFRRVVLLASVEFVNLTTLLPRIVVLRVVVAVALTLLVLATEDVSVVKALLRSVRTHLLPLIFFTA